MARKPLSPEQLSRQQQEALLRNMKPEDIEEVRSRHDMRGRRAIDAVDRALYFMESSAQTATSSQKLENKELKNPVFQWSAPNKELDRQPVATPATEKVAAAMVSQTTDRPDFSHQHPNTPSPESAAAQMGRLYEPNFAATRSAEPLMTLNNNEVVVSFRQVTPSSGVEHPGVMSRTSGQPNIQQQRAA